jgi:hypothetical protein
LRETTERHFIIAPPLHMGSFWGSYLKYTALVLDERAPRCCRCVVVVGNLEGTDICAGERTRRVEVDIHVLVNHKAALNSRLT